MAAGLRPGPTRHGPALLQPRTAHSGLRQGSDRLASHRLRPGPTRHGPALLQPRTAHSGLRQGSDRLASHRLRPGPTRPGTGPGRLGPGPTSTSPGSPKAAGPRWQLSHSPSERTKVPGPRGDRLHALRGGPASTTSTNGDGAIDKLLELQRGRGHRQAPRAAISHQAQQLRPACPLAPLSPLASHLLRTTPSRSHDT